jgi:hypothetical protein
MKSKLLCAMLAALFLTTCEQKNAAIRDELRVIEKTSKDTTQTKCIQESAGTFADILSGKQGISDDKRSRAHWAMACDRNPTVISTYVAFLKALEKQIPDKLPSVETYEAMEVKLGKERIIEYNVARTVSMMSSSIKNISLYGNAAADAEIDEILRQLNAKHGASETGKKILEFLNIVHEQGIGNRAKGIKPWESPRRPQVYTPGPVD